MDESQPIELDLAPKAPGRELSHPNITLEKIREMVELFYSRTAHDELLGPIFNQRVKDWEAHYEKMTRFWSSAAIGAGTYSGRPIELHKFGGLSKEHFERWVQMFVQAANDIFPESDAAVFANLGKKMASSIAMRIGTGRIEFSEQNIQGT